MKEDAEENKITDDKAIEPYHGDLLSAVRSYVAGELIADIAAHYSSQSLYSAILNQVKQQLRPLRFSKSSLPSLQRYFEDILLENNLSALVIEALEPQGQRSLRELGRITSIGRTARYSFFFVSPEDALVSFLEQREELNKDSSQRVLKVPYQAVLRERFIIIADSRFSALFVSVPAGEDEVEDTDYDVIWSFEPRIVYSALELLMARIAVEHRAEASLFAKAMLTVSPMGISQELTISILTSLAQHFEEHAVRELAVNRISTAIRSTLELPSVLQATVNEVGRALGAQLSALNIEGEHGQPSLTKWYFRDGEEGDEDKRTELLGNIEALGVRLRGRIKTYIHDGSSGAGESDAHPMAAVPVIYHDRTMGVLMVMSDDPERVWQDNEIMLLRTAADQVAVAVNHARLFQQMQHQALTDGLTGCFNRRFFEIQLERDLYLATRMRQPVSLILIDIDHFKRINDTHGHIVGDEVLRVMSLILRDKIRGVDTAARYGGEEFVIILPQAGPEGALAIAESLRAHIERTEVPGVGAVTASLGIATFPLHASSRDLLVSAADRALYQAKRTGRNRVCTPADFSEE